MHSTKPFPFVAAIAAISLCSSVSAQTKQASTKQTPAAAQQTSAAPVSAAKSRINPKDGSKYLWIPPGSFTIGCSPGDKDCYRDEKRDMKITLTRGFWLGETETTQGAYKKIMPKNPSRFKGDNLPVEYITQEDAVKYCKAIGARLPSEAEWEWAA